MGEVLRKLIYIGAMCVLIYSVVDAYNFKFGTEDMHEDKDSITNLYNQGADTNPDNNINSNPDAVTPDVGENSQPDDPGSTDEPVVESPYPAGMLPQFQQLYDINSDIIGWIVIDGFGDENGNYIEYPVMQTTDNDYYLARDFFRNEKSYGAIFADYRGKITATKNPDVTIIYGHNMGAGTFFSKLHSYQNKPSFAKQNNIISYSTLWEENEYIVFGCFLTGVREDQDNIPIFKYQNYYNFRGDLARFDYWYKNILYRNYYLTDIECTIDDEYILLSTCSRDLYDARLVIVARKVREGEDTSKYTYISNANVRLPEVYYESISSAVRPSVDNGPDYEYYDPDNPDAPYIPKADITTEEIKRLLESYIKIDDNLNCKPTAFGEVDYNITDESGTYYKVIDESIDIWEEWQSYLAETFEFDSEPYEFYANHSGMINVDGYTYASSADVHNEFSEEYEYSEVYNTPERYVVNITRKYKDGVGDTYVKTIIFDKTDAGWRIS